MYTSKTKYEVRSIQYGNVVGMWCAGVGFGVELDSRIETLKRVGRDLRTQ